MTAYGTGQRFTMIPAGTNTGATTVNITPSGGSALGAKNIFWNGAACVGGEIRINVPLEIMYDGTQFQIIGSASMVQVKGATLTANRVPYAVGAASLVQDSANLTFDGTTLTANTLTVSTGALTVTGGSLVTGAASSALFNTVATTLNIGGAATTLNLGAATGTATIANASTVLSGTLTSGRIQSSGTIVATGGIGDDTASSIRMSYSTGSGRVYVQGANASTNAGYAIHSTRSDGSNALVFESISIAGAVTWSQYGAGTLTTDASGNITAVSDIQVKRDVRPYTRGIEALIGLNPILHGYTAASGFDQSRNDYAGFSAQNVQQYFPEAVGKMADGMLTLNDRPLLAATINAVKEHHFEIAQLTRENVAMQAALAANGITV